MMGISHRPAQPGPASIGRPWAHLIRAVKTVLIVDPDPRLRRAAQEALPFVAVVAVCSNFRDARARLVADRPDLLVTNIRLDAHNGLHLVHLATAQTLCLVYGTDEDLPLAREAQAAGAFFVRPLRLAEAMRSFVVAELPTRDRRDPNVVDRRASFRGGRRTIDR